MRSTNEQQTKQERSDRLRLALWHPLLKRLLSMVREIESDVVEIQRGLQVEATASRFLTKVGALRWTHHYEHPFFRQYVETLMLAGASPALLLMLRPAKAVRAINAFAHGDDADFDFDLRLTPKSAAAIFAIRRTAHCFVASGRTLNAVMASAQSGSVADLLYALRIDPSILLSRTAQVHIARASTQMEPDFFPALGNALLNPVQPSVSFDLDWCLLF